MRLLVTGATGFIGRAFVVSALQQGWIVRVALRNESNAPTGCEGILVGDLSPDTDWREAVEGCDAVVHLAARVHVMNETIINPETEFRRINTEGTTHLAEQAAEAGVKRFLFVSTIKVNGEGREKPFVETDEAAPQDPYAISKWESEKALRKISGEKSMDFVILRPCLVYGEEVRANFLILMHGVNRGFPFPLANVENRRSLVYVENLVSAMVICLTHDKARNKLFLVSDGEDVSTPDLIRRIGKALDRSARLVPVPLCILRTACFLLGKTKQIDRLVSSLTLDSSALRGELGWTPPFSLDESLSRTARWYQNEPTTGRSAGR